jgi:hypothetical protein
MNDQSMSYRDDSDANDKKEKNATDSFDGDKARLREMQRIFREQQRFPDSILPPDTSRAAN